jgi:hypothetical protein
MHQNLIDKQNRIKKLILKNHALFNVIEYQNYFY